MELVTCTVQYRRQKRCQRWRDWRMRTLSNIERAGGVGSERWDSDENNMAGTTRGWESIERPLSPRTRHTRKSANIYYLLLLLTTNHQASNEQWTIAIVAINPPPPLYVHSTHRCPPRASISIYYELASRSNNVTFLLLIIATINLRIPCNCNCNVMLTPTPSASRRVCR